MLEDYLNLKRLRIQSNYLQMNPLLEQAPKQLKDLKKKKTKFLNILKMIQIL